MRYVSTFPVSLLTVVIICYLSFFQTPQTSLNEIPNIDKIVHICMYGGLTTLIWIEYLFHRPAFTIKAFLVGSTLIPMCMSGCIEILQEYCTANRSGDWLDFLANIIGIACATLLGFYVWRPLFTKYHSSHEA